ncbi:hypothetical protein M427DRAFT_130603 [Gonapodya prolifera JEL478]|uniref:NAD(P)-binding domain-containing protein n=1 Tax=Gonapodya prolifera (strain JEL478) TaxID=1344416 RepID=A0A139AYW7_GONPJ|nr:hypothetical protein M427DRAFT_130603 [Gonapodya prolifera JEL478]|eukprot:KXS21919.1 hypothetical protein M427DRAFT_130603 [Gonapodya prolifera JEL478]
MSAKPTVTFFGATGGCAGSALAAALADGFICSALARNPAKLYDQLRTYHNLDLETISGTLTVITGDVTDATAVVSVLMSFPGGRPADVFVCGVGGAPALQWSIYPITLVDPHICEKAAKCVVDAVRAIQSADVPERRDWRPHLTVVTSTGIDDRHEDVPFLFRPLYHWLLAVPHKDKRIMENVVVNAWMDRPGSTSGCLGGFTIVRPSLLTDGEELGSPVVRVGAVDPPVYGGNVIAAGQAAKDDSKNEIRGPAVGYTISRRDVGKWIFENVIRQGSGDGWRNKLVTLTY